MSHSKHFALAAVALVVSSIALYFGTGLHPAWWTLWFAPIPILLAAPRLSRTANLAVASLAWIAGGLNMWSYFHVLLEIPLGVILVIMVMPALVFAVDVLAYRSFLQFSPWRAALVFPSIWVAYEFLSERMSPHSTFGNISYSQMNFMPMLQLASVTGIWGISFCLFLFAATVAVLFGGRASATRKLALTVGCVLLAVLGFGYWRLHFTPPAQDSVVVGLVASDLRQNILTEKHQDTLRLLHEYAAQVEMLAAQGAKVVVIPEKVAVLLDSDVPEVDVLFRATAAKTGASIILGVIHPTTDAKWNEARIYSPDGEIREYEKHHMIPSFESDLTVGTTRTEWRQPSGLWGVTICKDMDFPPLSRVYGNDGSGLLLVPAWDFDKDGWLHSRMGILRGVESGFSIARAAKQGVLTITDDTGRVLAERETNSAPFASLVAVAPVRHTATIYARYGDWFGWLNVCALIGLVVEGFMARRRTRGTTRLS